MEKSLSKSKQSLVDAEKVIRLANDVVAVKIKNIDEIKDKNLQQIVIDGIDYQKDKINPIGSKLLGLIGVVGGFGVVDQSIKHSANSGLRGATAITSGLKNMGQRIGIPSMKGGIVASTIITLGMVSVPWVLGKVFIPPMDKFKKEELLSESEKVLEKLSIKISDEEINNVEFLLTIKLMVINVIVYLKNDLGIAE